jgi:hypothetical protein
MLDVARSKARTRARAQPRKYTWGIVDAILALVMLPFGIWMLVIEGLVNSVARLVNGRTPRPTVTD